MKGPWKKAAIVIVAVLLLQMAIGVAAVSTANAAPPAYGPIYHCVKSGETLFSIGRLYGVSPWAIARANNLANPNCIYAGSWLLIPTGQQPCQWGCYQQQRAPTGCWGYGCGNYGGYGGNYGGYGGYYGGYGYGYSGTGYYGGYYGYPGYGWDP
jgi:hypothetical protein